MCPLLLVGGLISFESDFANGEPPPIKVNPCRSCANYVGFRGNGSTLHCAMYPYGPDSDECPDLETRDTHQAQHRAGHFN